MMKLRRKCAHTAHRLALPAAAPNAALASWRQARKNGGDVQHHHALFSNQDSQKSHIHYRISTSFHLSFLKATNGPNLTHIDAKDAKVFKSNSRSFNELPAT